METSPLVFSYHRMDEQSDASPEFDKVIEATRLEQDPVKRRALFKKASEIVWDDAPWIWLHVEKFLIAHRSNIKGVELLSTEMFYPTYATTD